MGMFGLCFMQAITELVRQPNFEQRLLAARIQPSDAKNFWGSLAAAMHSLYLSTTSGTDWASRSKILWEAGPGYYMVFCFYIGRSPQAASPTSQICCHRSRFFMFVVMNTLTSLFV